MTCETQEHTAEPALNWKSKRIVHCGIARHRVTASIRNGCGVGQVDSDLAFDRSQSPTANAKDALSADAAFRNELIELIPFLRAFARSLCRTREDAEDLAQDSMTKAWQARASFQPGTNLKAWLSVIQRNLFRSAKRRDWRKVDWNPAVVEPKMVTQGAQQSSAELTDLRRVMTMLPDDQREALILLGAAGFTYKEAASICHCPVGTLKSRVSRARQAIMAMMGKDEHPINASESECRQTLEIVDASDLPQGS